MLQLEKIQNIYFIGIGGIGMSALARYFNAAGKFVCGYDRTSTTLTDELISEGIEVHFEENTTLIPESISNPADKNEVLIVYTPAVPETNKELAYFKENGFEVKKRAEILSSIAGQKYTIAIAGTHGKTTISSMVAHIFKYANKDCTAFLGGISQNYNTNFLFPKTEEGSVFVTEADEYDRSFLALYPDIAVITSIDADHLDIYGDENKMREAYIQFAKQVKNTGKLIIKENLHLNNDVSPSRVTTRKAWHQYSVITYSLSSPADYYAENITIENGQYIFDVISPVENIKGLKLGLPGRHNVENAIAAIAVAQTMELETNNIKEAINSFKGVKRRFEYQVKTDNMIFIDDYAHHPTEIKACISAVRELYPCKKITGIFQPHLYSRTRDFANEFARGLELLDELILLDIYPARELPIEGVNAKMLFDKIELVNKKMCKNNELIDEIGKDVEVLLTLGAGDIDQLVEPIKDKLLSRIRT